ncbi:hypothetical protein BKA70DRAFT_1219027 [Coprinopsis sp. MPI-PUGE-AT-0042]|nr:hypothetical protein BKA70DRAFT_1219027 [Coprinopsis sp. MPI-PUGE-AT-0042]
MQLLASYCRAQIRKLPALNGRPLSRQLGDRALDWFCAEFGTIGSVGAYLPSMRIIGGLIRRDRVALEDGRGIATLLTPLTGVIFLDRRLQVPSYTTEKHNDVIFAGVLRGL